MPNLVGIGNSQVPTNAMLGGLAYQDPSHAVLTNVELGDIADIKAKIGNTAVTRGIFIYDTRKDSDGGAWRKRTQHTSWYNEPLGTNIRGYRKEFPSIAVIVVETLYVSIYDGDDPDLPLWMKFRGDKTTTPKTLLNWYVSGTAVMRCASALNGLLVFGGEGGLYEVDLIRDWMQVRYQDTYYGLNPDNVSTRDGVKLTYSNTSGLNHSAIVNRYVNDISMSVLDGEPVDPTTGLARPTIAVATNGGISIIWPTLESDANSHYYDDVSQLTGTSQTSGNVEITDITLTKDGYLFASHQYATEVYELAARKTLTSAYYNGISGYVGRIANGTTHIGVDSESAWSIGATIYSKAIDSSNAITRSVDGLTLSHGEPQFAGKAFSNNALSNGYYNNKLTAIIRYNSNTGWMANSPKAAYFISSDTTDLSSPQLVTNGAAAALNLSNWSSGSSATVTIETASSVQYIQVKNSTSSQGYVYQSFATVSGEQYCISFTTDSSVGGSNQSSVWLRVGHSGAASVDTLNINGHGGRANTPGYSYNFNATGTTTTVSFMVVNTGANKFMRFSNVSCQLASIVDRSKKARNAAPYNVSGTATIAKTAISGTDMVYYSGFSNTNYVIVGGREGAAANKVTTTPNNATHLDYGGTSANYFFSGWINSPSVGGGQYLFRKTPDDSNRTFELWIAADLQYVSSWHGNTQLVTGQNVFEPGEWTHIMALRRGNHAEIWVNGLIQAYSPSTSSIDSTIPMIIGYGFNSATKIALFKWSGKVPTPTQMQKIYRDEKQMFDGRNNVTLYGTSNNIKGMDYDSDTGLVHVGTSGGRSDFHNLCRINNTTTAVATSLAAESGLIVEQ